MGGEEIAALILATLARGVQEILHWSSLQRPSHRGSQQAGLESGQTPAKLLGPVDFQSRPYRQWTNARDLTSVADIALGNDSKVFQKCPVKLQGWRQLIPAAQRGWKYTIGVAGPGGRDKGDPPS